MITLNSLLKGVVFFEAAGEVTKFGSNPKANHYNQVKLVQIHDKHCRRTNCTTVNACTNGMLQLGLKTTTTTTTTEKNTLFSFSFSLYIFSFS